MITNNQDSMNCVSTEKSSPDSTSFFERLKKEVQEGSDASLDPVNAGLPDHFIRTTTIYSPWYTRTCPVCKLKFRENDNVRICPFCKQAYHDDDQYSLHCWQKHFANDNVCKKEGTDPILGIKRKGCKFKPTDAFNDQDNIRQQEHFSGRIEKVSEQFLLGLESMWKPFGNSQIIEVKPDDPMIGQKCPWCRFSIRVGDRVVKCPCNNCNTYFHNDIFRHLECWNDWNGTKGNDFCPTTGAKIDSL